MRVETALSASEVQFAELDRAAIRDYVASGEADDKAGAYGIQGRAARFIVELRGSYSGVMGLPLHETARLVERIGTAHG
jgi:septum formation protein